MKPCDAVVTDDGKKRWSYGAARFEYFAITG